MPGWPFEERKGDIIRVIAVMLGFATGRIGAGCAVRGLLYRRGRFLEVYRLESTCVGWVEILCFFPLFVVSHGLVSGGLDVMSVW